MSTDRPAGCHATLPPGPAGAGTSGTGTTVVVVGAGGVVVVVVAFALGSLFALAAGTDASGGEHHDDHCRDRARAHAANPP